MPPCSTQQSAFCIPWILGCFGGVAVTICGPDADRMHVSRFTRNYKVPQLFDGGVPLPDGMTLLQ